MLNVCGPYMSSRMSHVDAMFHGIGHTCTILTDMNVTYKHHACHIRKSDAHSYVTHTCFVYVTYVPYVCHIHAQSVCYMCVWHTWRHVCDIHATDFTRKYLRTSTSWTHSAISTQTHQACSLHGPMDITEMQTKG